MCIDKMYWRYDTKITPWKNTFMVNPCIKSRCNIAVCFCKVWTWQISPWAPKSWNSQVAAVHQRAVPWPVYSLHPDSQQMESSHVPGWDGKANLCLKWIDWNNTSNNCIMQHMVFVIRVTFSEEFNGGIRNRVQKGAVWCCETDKPRRSHFTSRSSDIIIHVDQGEDFSIWIFEWFDVFKNYL